MTDDILDQSKAFKKPTSVQIIALIEFMKKHPEIAHKKRGPVSKINILWNEISNILNSLDGVKKTTKGWIKYWSIKTRSVMLKLKEGNISHHQLSFTEQSILDLYGKSKGKRKLIKYDNVNEGTGNYKESISHAGLYSENNSTTAQKNDMKVMEKILAVMEQQGKAMGELAKISVVNSMMVDNIAEARYIQALAVDNAVNTFETINTSINCVRDTLTSINCTLKEYLPAS